MINRWSGWRGGGSWCVIIPYDPQQKLNPDFVCLIPSVKQLLPIRLAERKQEVCRV